MMLLFIGRFNLWDDKKLALLFEMFPNVSMKKDGNCVIVEIFA